MRPGPKFEITQDMAIENIRTVFQRIGGKMLTRKLYQEHGSFAIRAIERKWGWVGICKLAGVPCGVRGSKKAEWHACHDCQGKLTVDRFRGVASSRYWYCYGCRKKHRRNSGGIT